MCFDAWLSSPAHSAVHIAAWETHPIVHLVVCHCGSSSQPELPSRLHTLVVQLEGTAWEGSAVVHHHGLLHGGHWAQHKLAHGVNWLSDISKEL